MIDYFYFLVENDQRINHLFPGDFKETSRKQKQFLTQFLGGLIYTLKNMVTNVKRDIWHLELLLMKEMHG